MGSSLPGVNPLRASEPVPGQPRTKAVTAPVTECGPILSYGYWSQLEWFELRVVASLYELQLVML